MQLFARQASASRARKQRREPGGSLSVSENRGTRRSSTSAAPVASTRYQAVDLLRGIAILLMFVYHFVFDLVYFKVLHIDLNHEPFWLGFRGVIVSLFLGLVGVSLYLATARGLRVRSYVQRLALLVAYAGLVSAASYMLFPRSVIFFGVLHFIAVASVLGLLFVRFYWTNLILGGGVILLGFTVQHPVFDQPVLQWFGLMTHKPVTQDYVPLLPWFGVVLLGLFLGKTMYGGERLPILARGAGRHPMTKLLAFGGRHSLHIYMLHQPVFMGMLYLFLGR